MSCATEEIPENSLQVWKSMLPLVRKDFRQVFESGDARLTHAWRRLIEEISDVAQRVERQVASAG